MHWYIHALIICIGWNIYCRCNLLISVYCVSQRYKSQCYPQNHSVCHNGAIYSVIHSMIHCATMVQFPVWSKAASAVSLLTSPGRPLFADVMVHTALQILDGIVSSPRQTGDFEAGKQATVLLERKRQLLAHKWQSYWSGSDWLSCWSGSDDYF